jgi:platelet-activating factor acetylhydrolase
VYFSIYYPTAVGTTSTKPQHPWIPVPGAALIAQGLAQASDGSVPASLIQIGFNAFAANLTIPAQVDVPILLGSNKLPTMIFSHGNPTQSQWYSQFYGELASHGIIVCAVTHRDGSSPATRVSFKNGTNYDIIAFTEAQVS